MRDYVTTVFNLIVGLVNADKIVYLALIGLGVILVWQLISLLTNFHRRFAGKCRKISKFLMRNGLSANNYNNFLALVAKMPQEFIRGYKTFEHASYGLPSDYIKRFDAIDVETNGGILNHGKSLIKATIYGWTIILFVLSLALLGSDAALSGYALADALLVPVLFLILAKIVYFIFNAIKQQQYKMAVDEFNEMLDIMNDKIENNDTLPGPDVLADLMDSVPLVDNTLAETNEENIVQEETVQPTVERVVLSNQMLNDLEQNSQALLELQTQEDSSLEPEKGVEEETELANDTKNDAETFTAEDLSGVINSQISESEKTQETAAQEDMYTEEELVDEVANVEQADTPEVDAEIEELAQVGQTVLELSELNKTEETNEINQVASGNDKEETNINNQEIKEDEMEEKRGRGRPKKVAEGELVIKNDKQFEEVLQRAEKLMRKSEEALSSSQAKRVEKSLKELIDAMTKYKEEH